MQPRASPGAVSWPPQELGSIANELIFAMYVETHVELGRQFRTRDHPANPSTHTNMAHQSQSNDCLTAKLVDNADTRISS